MLKIKHVKKRRIFEMSNQSDMAQINTSVSGIINKIVFMVPFMKIN